MAMDWMAHEVPLGYGLQQQADARALLEPALTICRDTEFRQLGGLQPRYPFADLGNVSSVGDALVDQRKLVANGDELLCFTKDSLYSWDIGRQVWNRKATHLAVKIDHASVFAGTGDQIDCDRAELGGSIIYCWIDAGRLFMAAVDATTGATIYGPNIRSTAATRPHLVAVQNVVMLLWVENGGGGVANVRFAFSNPADPEGFETTPTTFYSVSSSIANVMYDAVASGSACYVALHAHPATSGTYKIATINTDSSYSVVSKARACNGPIAIAAHPDGSQLQIARTAYVTGSTAPIVGDRLTTTTLADVHINQALGSGGSTINQVAAEFSTTAPGRCMVFWSSNESSYASFFTVQSSYAESNGSVGATSIVARQQGIASRAFRHDGRVYLWAAFAGESSFSGVNASQFRAQLQNTYFLYRDDGLLVAKAAAGRAGGFAATRGSLPHVQALGSGRFAWIGNERRRIQLGGVQHSGFDARTPCDVSLTFDSQEARRTARLGSTLYLAGGEILQYDGAGLAEVGFHIYPWNFGSIELPTGALVGGTYGIKCTWRWENAKGETERSTTATVGTVTITVPPNGIDVQSPSPLYPTHKLVSPPALEVWRTQVNQTTRDASFFLVTSKDPTALSGSNRYIANDATATSLPTLHDELSDSDAGKREANDENGLRLSNVSPPPAAIVVASKERLFLAGVAGEPNAIWYSQLRTAGTVAAFSDICIASVPSSTGRIVALAWNGEVLAVFTERACYALDGAGYDNAGAGANYEARLVDEVGALSHEAVATTERGVVFRSSYGGWRLLTRSWNVEDIGGPVRGFDADTPVDVVAMEAKRHVRIWTSSRAIVFDLRAGQWAEWAITDVLSAVLWRGQCCVLRPMPQIEQTTHDAADYGMDIETAWIRPLQKQGELRVRRVHVLGAYQGPCAVRVRVAYDDRDAYVEDYRLAVVNNGGRVLVQFGPRRQQLSSIKIRLTVESATTPGAPPDGTEGLQLSGLVLQVGARRGLRRIPYTGKAS